MPGRHEGGWWLVVGGWWRRAEALPGPWDVTGRLEYLTPARAKVLDLQEDLVGGTVQRAQIRRPTNYTLPATGYSYQLIGRAGGEDGEPVADIDAAAANRA